MFRGRQVRPQWGLRTFLIVAAIAAAIVGVWLKPNLVPPARSFSTAVSTGIQSPRKVGIDILWEPGTSKDQLRQIVVYPSGIRIDFANDLRYAPSPKDISLRRTMVFVDGKRWEVKEPPCFLVFDASSRSFHEIPIAMQGRGVRTAEDVTRLPEWRSHVVPILERVYGASSVKRLPPRS